MKRLLAIVITFTFVMFATVALACEGGDCDGFSDGVGVEVDSYTHTWGDGDQVDLLAANRTAVDIQYGAVEAGDGFNFNGLNEFVAISSGEGHHVAGGTSNMNFDMHRLNEWGTTVNPGSDGCVTGCEKMWYDRTNINVGAFGEVNAYGTGPNAAFTAGVFEGRSPLGDNDGQWDINAAWAVDGPSDVNGGFDAGINFKKFIKIIK